MKTQQWQLRKIAEPRTLADVESSREKPVLCWWNSRSILPSYVNGIGLVHGITREGNNPMGSSPENHFLYHQPSRPTRLEDVPDRRVINARWQLDGEWESFLIFRHDKRWLDLRGQPGFQGYADPQWQLTDCVVELVETEVELVETEIGVVG